jgi:hypothetical protein
MPLEALYSLMKGQVADPDKKNVLNGDNFKFLKSVKLVMQQHFWSSGMDKTKVTDDVLAFCTLGLMYSKGAKKDLQLGQSPKGVITLIH